VSGFKDLCTVYASWEGALVLKYATKTVPGLYVRTAGLKIVGQTVEESRKLIF
jgi:hypothetical protein